MLMLSMPIDEFSLANLVGLTKSLLHLKPLKQLSNAILQDPHEASRGSMGASYELEPMESYSLEPAPFPPKNTIKLFHPYFPVKEASLGNHS